MNKKQIYIMVLNVIFSVGLMLSTIVSTSYAGSQSHNEAEEQERGPKGDWINKSTPCQFLDLKTNLCSIYEVRPADCASFPHLTKKKVLDYIDVHKQNITECPAAYKMVEKLKDVTGR